MDDFLLRAVLAGLGIAIVAGPLGSFVVWRRMAYFGNVISHSTLLGVAMALWLGIDITTGVVGVCIGLAASLLLLQRRQRQLSDDTLLGILAHGALAIGMVMLSFLETVRVDLMGYLFGDILAVSFLDLVWIYSSGVLTLIMLASLWQPLLSVTVHEELAQVEGRSVATVQAFYMLLLALYIAVAMKVVGMLLITALLVVPAATARRFVHTPETMAGLGTVIGSLTVTGGLWLSFIMDTPAGPTIVAMSLCLFGASLLWRTPPRLWKVHSCKD